MPHKSEKCPKCGARAKQIKFLKASAGISNSYVEHGDALFRCRYCKTEFEGFGIHRIGASKTYWKYKQKKEQAKQEEAKP